MACATTVTIPACQTGDIFREHNGLRRSESGKELCKQRGVIRRSKSDHHLCYSVNRIRAVSTKPKLKSSRSVGFFPFQLSSSMIPNSVKSFLFDPEMSRIDRDVVDESSEEESDIKKRANWMERLLEIRRQWAHNRQQESLVVVDDENEEIDCDCDVDADVDGGCKVCYSEDEDGDDVTYDAESFKDLLAQVPLSDTKMFAQLAFLCNMAYVIQEIKPDDLKTYYDLQFVTSSLVKKAEAVALKIKLDQDSTRVPVDGVIVSDESDEVKKVERVIRPSVASKIAASAASYVQFRAKGILSLGCEVSEMDGSLDSCGVDDVEEDGGSSPRVYKSEVAAYVAASTMTAVVAAGEKQKQEAARDLQSLHSSPCEWFICDDTSTYTRCFVIQVSL